MEALNVASSSNSKMLQKCQEAEEKTPAEKLTWTFSSFTGLGRQKLEFRANQSGMDLLNPPSFQLDLYMDSNLGIKANQK